MFICIDPTSIQRPFNVHYSSHHHRLHKYKCKLSYTIAALGMHLRQQPCPPPIARGKRQLQIPIPQNTTTHNHHGFQNPKCKPQLHKNPSGSRPESGSKTRSRPARQAVLTWPPGSPKQHSTLRWHPGRPPRKNHPSTTPRNTAPPTKTKPGRAEEDANLVGHESRPQAPLLSLSLSLFLSLTLSLTPSSSHLPPTSHLISHSIPQITYRLYKAFHIANLSHLIAAHSTGWCGDGGDDGGIELRDGAGVEGWRTGAGDGDGVKAAGGEVNEMIGGARMRVWCDCGTWVCCCCGF
jgi:hypothetical protein